MSTPFWDEYARVQRRVEFGKARDGQLDAMLKRQPGTPRSTCTTAAADSRTWNAT